jgi:hypothetical protein
MAPDDHYRERNAYFRGSFESVRLLSGIIRGDITASDFGKGPTKGAKTATEPRIIFDDLKSGKVGLPAADVEPSSPSL